VTFTEPSAADENRHPFGEGDYWSESYYLDFFDDGGTLGGYLRIGLYPNLGDHGTVWYWGCVVEQDHDLVTVIDHEVPLPSSDRSLEIRTQGLWADHNIETPLDHMSIGLEAFGVGLDDPTAVYHGSRGTKVALGFELDWETDGRPYAYPLPAERYEIPCRVHGQILRGDDRLEFDGWGQRDHSWGERDWWQVSWVWMAGRLDDGTRIHATQVRLPGFDWATGYTQINGQADQTDQFTVDKTPTDDGLVRDISFDLAGVAYEAQPVAWSPVLLEAPDGRVSHFARAMTRFTCGDGRTGVGWMEFNQPVGIDAPG
jgi:hypothetical protein